MFSSLWSFSISWLLKEWLYRDASWETPCTLGSAIFLFVGMGLGFWINIVFLTLGDASYDPSPLQLCMILIIYTLGIWLHHTADTQKYFVLRARKGLITDGLFSMSRNPNYLGEMFIYGSFAGNKLVKHKKQCFQVVFNELQGVKRGFVGFFKNFQAFELLSNQRV